MTGRMVWFIETGNNRPSVGENLQVSDGKCFIPVAQKGRHSDGASGCTSVRSVNFFSGMQDISKIEIQ